VLGPSTHGGGIGAVGEGDDAGFVDGGVHAVDHVAAEVVGVTDARGAPSQAH
jgi:hypothetical protein